MLKTKEVGASREGAFSCCPANLPRSVYKHLLLAQGVTVGGVSIGHVSRRHRYNAQIKEEKVASFDDWFFPAEETLYVNGKAVVVANETYDVSSARIFAYHKPENVVADANRGSKLYGIGSEIMTRYGVENRPFPIGQLDKNTTGLLLFTTNGHVANFINLPGRVRKTYLSTYNAPAGNEPTDVQMAMLVGPGVDVSRKGEKRIVKLESCKLLAVRPATNSKKRKAPMSLEEQSHQVHRRKFKYDLEMTIKSGANHIIKRVMNAAKLPPCAKLQRQAIGDLCLNPGGKGGAEALALGVGETAELTMRQKKLIGLPSEKDLLQLRMCQLLCQFRAMRNDNRGESSDRSLQASRLEGFLKENFRIDGSCFMEFPGLGCRWCNRKKVSLNPNYNSK
jgi:pseudouridine synthase